MGVSVRISRVYTVKRSSKLPIFKPSKHVLIFPFSTLRPFHKQLVLSASSRDQRQRLKLCFRNPNCSLSKLHIESIGGGAGYLKLIHQLPYHPACYAHHYLPVVYCRQLFSQNPARLQTTIATYHYNVVTCFKPNTPNDQKCTTVVDIGESRHQTANQDNQPN